MEAPTAAAGTPVSVGGRVLISGYYGFGNAGDEAILAGLIQGLRKLRPDAELIVLSGDPSATASAHGVIAVPRGLRSVRRHLSRSDLLISGGGGLLQDATSWRSPLYYLAVMELAHRAGVPTAFVGQSVGPLRRSWIRRLVRRTLSRVNVIGVRDETSQLTLARLGLARTGEVTADLAFLLPSPGPDMIAAARKQAGIPDDGRQLIGLAVRPRPGRPIDEGLARQLTRALKGIQAATGASLVLLPMQPSQDLPFAQRIAAGLPEVVVAPALSVPTLVALVASCEVLVAMRLHALVFAALSAVPIAAVSYDPKVDGLLSQLGLRAVTTAEAFDACVLERAVIEAWENRKKMPEDQPARLAELRAAARRNIELARSLLPPPG